MTTALHPQPNPAASGNGAVTSLFHVGRLVGAVPEPRRWAAHSGLSILLFAAFLLIGTGCKVNPQRLTGQPDAADSRFAQLPDAALTPPAALPRPDLLHPGQALVMVVLTEPPGPQPLIWLMDVVKEDGSLTLLSNKVFSTTGKTRRELERELREYYRASFAGDRVLLQVTAPPTYSVRGRVNSPGLQVLLRPTTVLGAIRAAGGFTESANQRKVRLLRQGTVQTVNCAQAQQDPKLDIAILRNDEILVPRLFE